MLIDAHTHMIHPYEDTYKQNMELARCRFGVDHVIVSNLQSLYPDEAEIQTLNDATYQYMQERPDFVSGLCTLNPRHANAAQELERRLDQGFVGAKLWVATHCDDPLVDPIARICIDRNVPVLIHTFYKSHPEMQLPYESLGQNVANLARRFPELKLVMAHLGASAFRELPTVASLPNVWVDFSGSLCHADALPYALGLLGSKRILFGTDGPLVAFHPSIGQLLDAELTEEEREDISWRNADRLYLGGRYEKI